MYATCISCFYCLLKFLKRQDLLNVLARMMRPACDQVVRFHFFFLFSPLYIAADTLSNQPHLWVGFCCYFVLGFFCSKSK